MPIMIIKHEIGHLAVLLHNQHSGDESTFVLRTGLEIGRNAQRGITANDIQALENKYP